MRLPLLLPSRLDLLQGKYRKWAQNSKFELKLPGNVKKCKATAQAEIVMRTLDRDLKEEKTVQKVVLYTDRDFHRAANEWLIATDQVRSTFSTRT